jgi:hypothetical protein
LARGPKANLARAMGEAKENVALKLMELWISSRMARHVFSAGKVLMADIDRSEVVMAKSKVL